MKPTIREAKESDRAPVAELFKEMFDFHGRRNPHFTRTESGHNIFATWFVKQIEEDLSLPLVAEVGGEVVGYSLGIIRKYPSVFTQRDYGEVNDIAVTERCRRQGIGRLLFEETRAWFLSKGIRRIEARVATTNELSSAFWQKMGFRPYLETLVLEQKQSEQSD
jgi:ribosomal protein S18 acetylase RimI-like enzyme